VPPTNQTPSLYGRRPQIEIYVYLQQIYVCTSSRNMGVFSTALFPWNVLYKRAAREQLEIFIAAS
jgi:hypothetical protein